METTNGSDLYSSSENSPESHQHHRAGLMQHHQGQQHSQHHQIVGQHQMLPSSRLSPVSPATSIEEHQLHHNLVAQHHQHHQHLQQQQSLVHVPVGISVISSSSSSQQHLHVQQPDEDPTHQT